MLKVFVYERCTTCQKALKLLTEKGIPFEKIAINAVPPTKEDLHKMLQITGKPIRSLFNTSGMMYRDLHLKDSLGSMGVEEAINLLTEPGRGMLIKRPFVLGKKIGLLGFNEKEWLEAFQYNEVQG